MTDCTQLLQQKQRCHSKMPHFISSQSVADSVKTWNISVELVDTIRYDTIRDAILTCARKPTWVGLIYRTNKIVDNMVFEQLKRGRTVGYDNFTPEHIIHSHPVLIWHL